MQANPLRAGFIGFGEVASIFTKHLADQGVEISVYDVLLQQDGGLDILKERSQAAGIRFCPLSEVMESSSIIFSTVTTQFAKAAAESCVPLLGPGRIYVDLNSTSPSVKAELDQIIRTSGADFVEGAILGAVGATGASTAILTAGEKGNAVAEVLSGHGMRVRYYGPEIGKASMFKMLRSIFSKGLEGLILELLVAGKRAGIEDELWADITELMTHNPFEKVASNWVQSHATAHERRYHEMLQVAETMEELGLEPVMTAATIQFFKRSCSLGLKEVFRDKPDSKEQVICVLEAKLGNSQNEIIKIAKHPSNRPILDF
jgi:3-hydroxyisobutyrate dehydrogenase-like beta-hydroxyacid dehydrogenase